MHSLIYYKALSMRKQVYGTEYEAKMHAQNLGLDEPELVLQNIHHHFINATNTAH